MGVDQPSTTHYQLFSDYHMHPQGHRVQRYTQALLQPWADSARRLGLKDIAFTDHDRYHAGIDFDEINRLRERNPDLRIRAGIELDNDPVHSRGRPQMDRKTLGQAGFCSRLGAFPGARRSDVRQRAGWRGAIRGPEHRRDVRRLLSPCPRPMAALDWSTALRIWI